LGLWEA